MVPGKTPKVNRIARLLRDSAAAAHAAELRYVSADEPGIRRVRRGRGFVYLSPRGSIINAPGELRRIARLAIPPAWKDVWICRSANGHLQATGRDARGRKQYHYHQRWRVVRDEAKYEDILLFAERLPALRQCVAADVASPKLNKRKVIATLLRIMEQTRIRVGNDCYVANGSYGLTTLRDQHATISGGLVEFRFRGKGGRAYRASISDRRLANIVKRCRDIPGQRLFQYCDPHGKFRPVTSTDVNRYLRENMGYPFSAKSFRTWAATVGAALFLERVEPSHSARHAQSVIKRAIADVAMELGNTPAICKKCYIHPAILEAYTSGTLRARFAQCLREARRRRRGLMRPEEWAVLALFERLPRAPERAAA